MGARAIATIDIGTNTTLLLIARPRSDAAPDLTTSVTSPGRPASKAAATAPTAPAAAIAEPAAPIAEGAAPIAEPEVLVEGAEITRLGRGIGGDGRLGREGIERTLAVLARYAATAAAHGATMSAIGTEALRRAPNADEFLRPAQVILGAPVEVIDGDREAALTFRAVAESFPAEIAAGRVGIVDIGGGSTEIVVSDRGRVAFQRSLPLGSVRLHERHIHSDPATPDEAQAIEREVSAALDGVAAAFAPEPLKMLVGVAGTVTSLSAMTLGLPTYDPARVHGSTLALGDLDARIADLGTMAQAARERIPGLDPRRADVIFAGALLLRAIVRRAGVGTVRVSDRGIRWGLFYERAALADSDGLRPPGRDASVRA